MNPFPPTVLAGRHGAVFGALGDSALVLPAAPQRFKSRDTEVRYRASSELAYLTGILEPGAVAVFLGHATEERYVLFVPPRDAVQERWTGPVLGVERAAERPGVEAAYSIEELPARLPGLLAGARSVYVRSGEHAGVDRAVTAALTRARLRGAKDGSGPRGVWDPGEILDELRLTKAPVELDAMRRAAQVTVGAYERVIPRVGAGVGEWEIEAMLDGAFRSGGAWGPAYPTIVASGSNACVLHYTRNDRLMSDGDLVLIDAGAELSLYASDVTRTLPVSGRFTKTQRAVYEIVAEAQRAAIAEARPGRTLDDVHRAAEEIMISGLVELGALTGSADEIREKGAHSAFVLHKTSHWLGLDVHDVGDYVRDGAARPLQPGMVFSVEPGLYFPPAADGVPEELAGIGVRIEDEILITESGHENLTERLPRDTDDVEAWMG